MWRCARCYLGKSRLCDLFRHGYIVPSKERRRESCASHRIRKILRQGEQAHSRSHTRVEAEILLHRESERCDAEDGVHERSLSVHGDILSIWREEDEADRHLDEPSKSEIQTTVQERRQVSRASTERKFDRNARHHWKR